MMRFPPLCADSLLVLTVVVGCAEKIERPLSAAAVPGPTLVTGERSVARNIYCKGEPVVVQDQNSALTISDRCRVLRVTGSNNKVTLDIQSRGRIEVTGSGNNVAWHLADVGSPPEIIDYGSGNSIRQLRNVNAAP